MPYKIVLTETALKELSKINKFDRNKILEKIVFFGKTDKINVYSKKLKDFDFGDFRLRVGDYRLIYDLDKDLIIITKIDHRKDIYN